MNPHHNQRESGALNAPKTEVSKVGNYHEGTRQPQEWDATKETQNLEWFMKSNVFLHLKFSSVNALEHHVHPKTGPDLFS